MADYTFTNRSNAYFNGNDVVAENADGKTVTINGKDNMCAVYVKDREGAWVGSLPDDVKALAEDLNRSNKSRVWLEWSEDYTDCLYEQAREQWWEDAKFLAEEAGFKGVFSSGRSGGWCCIDGTNTEYHPIWIMHAEEQEAHEIDEAIEFRDTFLELAFNLVSNIDDAREGWIERIREAHAELEAEREQVLVRGTD